MIVYGKWRSKYTQRSLMEQYETILCARNASPNKVFSVRVVRNLEWTIHWSCVLEKDTLQRGFYKDIQLILNDTVTDILETTPLPSVKSVHFEQDGVPVHKTINVTNWFNKNFDKQRIGLSGATEWPLKSNQFIILAP